MDIFFTCPQCAEAILCEAQLKQHYITPTSKQQPTKCREAIESQFPQLVKKWKEGKQTGLGSLILPLDDFEFFADQYGEPYAAYSIEEHREVCAVKSRKFRGMLAGRIAKNNTLSSDKLSKALLFCESQALTNGKKFELHNRLAAYDGAFWIDRCDDKWGAIRIDSTGWKIIDKPPILFRRYAHQKKITIELGEAKDLEAFISLLNLHSEQDKKLIMGYLGALPHPTLEKPILAMSGPQGAAKSTDSENIRKIIDPSVLGKLKMPRDLKELVQILLHHSCAYFDNLHELSQGQSDTLCRAVTGEGASKRQLYSDDDDVLCDYKRAVGLNGINLPGLAPDLLDRTLQIELERIPADRRKSKREIELNFESLLPKVRGYLLSVMAKALEILPEVERKHKTLPRMADFALFAEASCQAMGMRDGEFMAAYFNLIGNTSRIAVEGSVLGGLILELVDAEGGVETSPEELYLTIKEMAYSRKISSKHPDMPKSATALSRKLNVLRTPLEEIGVKITLSRNHGGRRVSIARIAVSDLPSRDASVSQLSELPAPTISDVKINENDGGDASDAFFPLEKKEIVRGQTALALTSPNNSVTSVMPTPTDAKTGDAETTVSDSNATRNANNLEESKNCQLLAAAPPPEPTKLDSSTSASPPRHSYSDFVRRARELDAELSKRDRAQARLMAAYHTEKPSSDGNEV